MQAITVRFNTDQAVSAFDALGQRGHVALRRALRRTATSVRATMASVVGKDMAIRVGTVRGEVKLQIHPEDAIATISVSGARIPLIEFQARGPEPSRGKGRGVSARIKGERRRYPNAFIATMRSGHRGVFKRQAKARLPIVELFGPSLPHVFAKFIPLGIARAEEQLGKNLEHEFQFALSQE